MSQRQSSTPGEGQGAQVPAQAPPTPQRRAELERELNYARSPGRHTVLSPAAGSRSEELLSLRGLAPSNPAMVSFAQAIYEPQFVHLIPSSQADGAEAIGLDIFRRYLARYPGSGLTEANAVGWGEVELTRTYISDIENNNNTWSIQPVVYDGTHLRAGLALPRYLAALHEFMHVEETPRGARREWDRNPPGLSVLGELMPTVMTIIVADEAYKSVNGIPLSQVVNYGQAVSWDGHSVQVGKIANFYRSLIERYGSIGAAVASPESLEFMRQGEIPPRMVVPSRTP